MTADHGGLNVPPEARVEQAGQQGVDGRRRGVPLRRADPEQVGPGLVYGYTAELDTAAHLFGIARRSGTPRRRPSTPCW
ncbi:hypothetical protein MAHJHV55_13240 [Mycobacterium avium subsp. hominissuis]